MNKFLETFNSLINSKAIQLSAKLEMPIAYVQRKNHENQINTVSVIESCPFDLL